MAKTRSPWKRSAGVYELEQIYVRWISHVNEDLVPKRNSGHWKVESSRPEVLHIVGVSFGQLSHAKAAVEKALGMHVFAVYGKGSRNVRVHKTVPSLLHSRIPRFSNAEQAEACAATMVLGQ